MKKKQLILLSRKPVLYKIVASWRLPEVDIFLHDSPSEALAQLSSGDAALFLFDTANFARHERVIAKFNSLKGDADLVVLSDETQEGTPRSDSGSGVRAAVRRLPLDVSETELKIAVERLLRLRQVRARSGIVGRSRATAEMISLIAHVAPLDVNVLVMGESGTGKELVARAIHDHSLRAGGPFISLNCGAMSEGVLESELFGHARGAFTGAVSAHEGVFRRSDGGTLFLDEVGELPLGMQTRFLRALETGEFTAVGGSSNMKSDIRLVAATNKDLAQEVEEGRFRQDLYYRLRVIVIPTPPLRDRIEDVHILAEYFMNLENDKHGLSVRGFARSVLELMKEYNWPGNIRELRNMVRSLVVLKQSGIIEVEDLPAEIRVVSAPPRVAHPPVPLSVDRGKLERDFLTTTLFELHREVREIKEMLWALTEGQTPGSVVLGHDVVETFAGEVGYSPVEGDERGDLETAERSLIVNALRASGGNRRQAAERLGISERTLYRKIKRYGL